MGWELHTDEIRPDGVFSTLFRNGEKFCLTLEHAFEDGDGNLYPKLKRGATYKCVRGIHQLARGPKFPTFEITGVPGHSGILFHVGNFNKDSDGCVLMGKRLHVENSEHWIDDSHVSFTAFLKALEEVDEFDLTVE